MLLFVQRTTVLGLMTGALGRKVKSTAAISNGALPRSVVPIVAWLPPPRVGLVGAQSTGGQSSGPQPPCTATLPTVPVSAGQPVAGGLASSSSAVPETAAAAVTAAAPARRARLNSTMMRSPSPVDVACRNDPVSSATGGGSGIFQAGALSLVAARRATLSGHADESVNGANLGSRAAAPACECRVRPALPGRVGAAPAGAHGVRRGAPVQIRFRAQAWRRGRA